MYGGDVADGKGVDDRFYTPRQLSGRGSSEEGDVWVSPRTSARSTHTESDNEFYATPREHHSTPRTAWAGEAKGGYGAPPPHQSSSRGDSEAKSSSHHRPPAAAPWRGAEPKSATLWSASVKDEPARRDLAVPPRLNAEFDTSVDDIFSFARHNRVDDVDRLLLRGVPPDVRDAHGNTILIVAGQNGHKRIAKAALRRGGDIDASNHRGNTALHFCFAYGFEELGNYLIQKGADASVRNDTSLTCYEGLAR
ncbi:ankyrin repeat-containing domain protein [Pelagophyceae sp. CCMP2097]|nr:ankyrin repeat-containing domain protein [Pelagophyceae sp. CCMP2097]|mmetsp:Transcript_9727/g.32043  ORF Transcript_9727/g.32043 Transcript_9727/m.32043 type:complete len:251 (-) Transcript_9727:36-788(-)